MTLSSSPAGVSELEIDEAPLLLALQVMPSLNCACLESRAGVLEGTIPCPVRLWEAARPIGLTVLREHKAELIMPGANGA